MKTEENQGPTPPPLPHRQAKQAATAQIATLDQDRLFSFVCAMRRMFHLSALGRVLCWLGLAALLLIALDVTMGLSAELRWAGWGILGVGALYLVIRHGLGRASRFKMQEGVQTIEHGNPEVGQMFRTAHEVSKLSDPESKGVSKELAVGLMHRAADRWRKINPAKLLPRGVTAAWVTAGLAALAVLAALCLTQTDFRTGLQRLIMPGAAITFTKVELTTKDQTYNADRRPHILADTSGRQTTSATLVMEEPDGTWSEFAMDRLEDGRGFEAIVTGRLDNFRYYVKSGDGTSGMAVMENADPARLVASAAEIAFPDYTGLEPQSLETADVSALEGSQVALRFEMSAPMREATLQFPNQKTIPLEISGVEAETSHTMEEGEVIYELRGVDARGRKIEPVKFRLSGHPDEMPTVEMLEPEKEIQATAVAELPIRIRARDDFGVAELGIVLEVKGKKEPLIEKTLSETDLKDVSEVVDTMLEEYPLTIRDNIRVYAFARDHKPRNGAKAVSKLVGIDIKPFMRKWRFGGVKEGLG